MLSLPLEFYWNSQKVLWQDENGWKIPAAFSPNPAQAKSQIQNTALTDQSHRGKIKVTGSDRVSFLNRMLTNDLAALTAGQGQRSFLLSAQGKCLADFRIFASKDFLLLDTEPSLTADALKLLNRYIIADDVQLQDVTLECMHLSIDGPEAPDFQNRFEKCLPEAWLFTLSADASLSGTPALHVFVPTAFIPQTAAALGTLALPFLGHQAFEIIRREHKVPRFKIDFDETWVLNETGLEEIAASETKGCYPGQEVVARMKTYKKDARRLFI